MYWILDAEWCIVLTYFTTVWWLMNSVDLLYYWMLIAEHVHLLYYWMLIGAHWRPILLRDADWCTLMTYFTIGCWLVHTENVLYYWMLIGAHWWPTLLVDADWCTVLTYYTIGCWLVHSAELFYYWMLIGAVLTFAYSTFSLDSLSISSSWACCSCLRASCRSFSVWASFCARFSLARSCFSCATSCSLRSRAMSAEDVMKVFSYI